MEPSQGSDPGSNPGGTTYRAKRALATKERALRVLFCFFRTTRPRRPRADAAPMRFAPLAFAAVLVAATLPGFAGANQTYTLPDGRTVAFNDGGGNEWWVQVRLSGTAGGAATSVQAMPTGGAC